MYKNLSPGGLGISGRQSELIELTLTYGFTGFDVLMPRFVNQMSRSSLEDARRFIDSAANFANGFSIGGWQLDVRWEGDDAQFNEDLSKLGEIADVAGKIGATRCHTTIQPATDTLPYHENFERHRTRIGQVADLLAKYDIQLGLNFLPAPADREGKEHEFIYDFEGLTTLSSTVGAKNVGIVLDTWNWFVGGGGMDQLQQLAASQIVMVRLSDIPGDADLSSITENQRILPSEDGLIDAVAIVKLLVEKEFDGPVTPQAHPSNYSGQTREKIVQTAADCLEGLWIEAGLAKPKPEAVALVAAPSANGDGQEDKSQEPEGKADAAADDTAKE